MTRRARRSAAQTVTEYLLVVSVLVILIVAVAWEPLAQQMQSGTTDFRSNMATAADNGAIGQAGGNATER